MTPVPLTARAAGWVIFILALGAGFSVASIYYAQPLLPLMGANLHLSVEGMGLVPTLTQAGYALAELDLAKAGVRNIIWATGYTTDYRWLKVNAFNEQQRPQHHRGVSSEPGVYFLGLPWLSRRGSTFIWGVWHDAKYIADQIAIQRQYQRYQPSC